MNGTRHREVGEYLRRLQRAMGDLPPERRDEILSEIEEHIEGLLSEQPVATDADVLNVVERVGDPEDIAAEARQRLGITPSRRRWTDVAAIVLLLIGGFTIIGWFVGVVLLWISEVWSTREKIIGTLTLPGGLAGSLAVGAVLSLPGRTSSIGSVELLFLAVLVLIAPVVTAIYLGRRLAQSSREIG